MKPGYVQRTESNGKVDLSIRIKSDDEKGDISVSYSLSGSKSASWSSQFIELKFSEDVVYYCRRGEFSSFSKLKYVSGLGVTDNSYLILHFAENFSAVCAVSPFFCRPLTVLNATNTMIAAQTHLYSALLHALTLEFCLNEDFNLTNSVAEFIQVMFKIACATQGFPDHGVVSLILHACTSVCTKIKTVEEILGWKENSGLSLNEKMNSVNYSFTEALLISPHFCLRLVNLIHWMNTTMFMSGSLLDNMCYKLLQSAFNSLTSSQSLHHKHEGQCLKISLLDDFVSHFQKLSTRQAHDFRILETFIYITRCFYLDINSSVKHESSFFYDAFQRLPPVVRVAVYVASLSGYKIADKSWPEWMLRWIGRDDLIATNCQSKYLPTGNNFASIDHYSADKDGLVTVEQLNCWRYPEDERLQEVSRILRSSAPQYLRVERTLDASDVTHRQEQQKKLLQLCRRALCSAVGRGMFTMDSFTYIFQPGDKIPISYACLKGRTPPSNAILALDLSHAPTELTLWPDFHAGVAAGLR